MSKKFVLSLSLFLFGSILLQAQNSKASVPDSNQFFLAKDKALSIGIGFLNAESFTFNLFGSNGSGEPSPSIHALYEIGLTDMISIAGYVDYYRVDAQAPINLNTIADQVSGIDISDLGSVFTTLQCLLNPSLCANETSVVEERVNVFTLGGKLRIHRSFVPGLDTYASTYLGYSFNRRKTITESALDAVSNEVGLGIEVPTIVYYGSLGARYFVTDKLGIYGEYGVGNVHLLKIGVSLRM